MPYKRNQIEDAISQTIGEVASQPSPRLRIQLKRLLDLDRGLKRNSRSVDPAKAHYAFFSADAPGKGTEVLFSEYEAFALMLALLLLDHRWPQRFVVDTMRRIREPLGSEHHRILHLDRDKLFNSDLMRKKTQAGDLAVGNSKPAFLLIGSDPRTDGRVANGPHVKIFRDYETAFRFQMEKPGRSCTWLELVTPACALRHHLKSSLPKARGRNG